MKLFLKPLLATSVLAAMLTSPAVDAKDAQFKAMVKVKNLFSVTSSAPLDFGMIRAQSHDTDTASLVVSPDPEAGPQAPTNPTGGTATINVITAGSPASFDVSEAAPNQELTITNPTNVDVKPIAGSGPSFTLSDFSYHVTSGGTVGRVTDNKFKVDNEGNASFNMGATLSTNAATENYEDGEYEADLEITLDY
ncbi:MULTISPECIES: DUF4402 domain-containing protein [unclassified Pseudoalteromonas]|uniref:DUF4402 domain-containing protein n=1 Tax=unclassified Pseudoalteromonas TaxID=194690 RepID=UPI0030142E46